MDVSIVIVNWNTRDILRGCLASIFKETKGFPLEVIVVDNDSTDGSPQMVETEFPQVLLIANSENVGFATANNQGIAIARGRYVLLLNSDTIVLDNAIGKMISFAECNPEAGAMACRILNPDGTLQLSCFLFPSLLNMALLATYLGKLFPRSKLFGREMMSWSDWSNVCEVDVVAGCFMLVRREVIDQVGVLDERFFMYAEETDWCYRMKQAGWKILFTPDAEIIHLGGQSSSQKLAEMTLQLFGSILLFMKKHRGFLAHTLACFLVALFFILRVPYWLATGMLYKRQRSKSIQTAITYSLGGLYSLTDWKKLLVNRGKT